VANLDFRKSYPAEYRTRDGKFVRSKSERLIADWLYDHKIRNEYERKLAAGIVCDFYLPDIDTYIEYWGLEDKAYQANRKRKEEFYSKNRLKLISLEEKDVKRIDEVLWPELERRGLLLSPKPLTPLMRSRRLLPALVLVPVVAAIVAILLWPPPLPVFVFSLSNSGGITVTQGGSGSNTIDVILVSGPTQVVSLSASGLPSGSTPIFSPTSGNPTFPSTFTISTSPSTPTGAYTITVTGTGGGLTRTTTFTLAVNPPPPPSKWLRPNDPAVISYLDAKKYVGQIKTVEGTIIRTYKSDKNNVYLNFHDPYKGYFSAVIFAKDLNNFPFTPEIFYRGKEVRITGMIELYEGDPEIVVRNPSQIEIAYMGFNYPATVSASRVRHDGAVEEYPPQEV